MMKVILRSDVLRLGRAGDIKEVSPGFGRNFLIPRGKAVAATPGAVAWWEKGRERRETLSNTRTKTARELAAKIEGTTLSFSRQAGPEGKLFGSVGKSDILKSLKTCGFTVDKGAVALDAAIKKTGDYELDLKLLPDVFARIKVSVVARE